MLWGIPLEKKKGVYQLVIFEHLNQVEREVCSLTEGKTTRLLYQHRRQMFVHRRSQPMFITGLSAQCEFLQTK